MELRRKGWLLVLNDYFLPVFLNKFVTRLKSLKQEEVFAKAEFEKAKGKGIYAQGDAEKKLKAATKERRKMEKKCEHLLLVNYEYFLSLKKQRRTWLDKTSDLFVRAIVDRLNVNFVNENNWVTEMNKKLGN